MTDIRRPPLRPISHWAALAVLGTRVGQRWLQRRFAGDALLRTRTYRPADEQAIRRLFYATFRRWKSSRRWRWQFLENPYRSEANVVLLESDRFGIVGHYGGIPLRFHSRGTIIPVSQSADVMIHPAFRGMANLELLVHAYIRQSRAHGMKLLYGFNGAVVARSNRRFFGASLAPVSEWARDLTPYDARRTSGDGGPPVLPGACFDDRVDALWERVRGQDFSAVVRDRRYLDWRYSPRSDRPYAVCALAEASNDRLDALAVLGASASDGLILELLAEPGEVDSIAILLRVAIAHFARAGRRRARVWLSGHGRLRECAQAAGFRPVDSGLYLNILAIDDALDSTTLQKSFDYTLGDYDVN